MQAANGGRSEVRVSCHSPPPGRVNKDERYLRDLQNKSTAAAQKQQQAVVVESSELLNHIQYIPAKAIKIPTTRQMSFPVILYFPFFFSIMQNYENRAIYPKWIYRSMSDVLLFSQKNEYEDTCDRWINDYRAIKLLSNNADYKVYMTYLNYVPEIQAMI